MHNPHPFIFVLPALGLAAIALAVTAMYLPSTTATPTTEAVPATSSASGDTATSTATAEGQQAFAGPKIYVNFVSHNEDEFHADYPNYLEDEAQFWVDRNNAIAYAQMLARYGVHYNFQTDWNFLLAVAAFDTGDEVTGGKNVIRYLHEDLGVEIDAHSHENEGYNFVDVTYLIAQLGVTPSGVVGGFIAAPASRSKLEYFWSISHGERYPSATWQPEILWGGGTAQHQEESAYWVSGIWQPRDAEHFNDHDPLAPLPTVGHYMSSWDGLEHLVEKFTAGELAEDGFYTAAIMLNQADMDASNRDAYEEKLKEYLDEADAGIITFATITETYRAFVESGAESTMLRYDGASTNNYSGDDLTSSDDRCGNGVCEPIERQRDLCPADCT